MSIVYCDLVNGIDWYALGAYAAGTTYAADDLVKSTTSTTSANAQVWKSLQNANTGNALEEGEWWTLVADGSAAKPFKTIADGTRGTSADDIRIAASPAHTELSNPGNYTFYYSGTYAGKCVVTGVDATAFLSVDDYIGDDTQFWRIRSMSYTAGNTIITFGGSTDVAWMDDTLSNWTPTVLYKCGIVNNSQSITDGGISVKYPKIITGGWNLSTETRSAIGRTYVKGFTIINKVYLYIDGICSFGSGFSFYNYRGRIKNAMFAHNVGQNIVIGGSYGLEATMEDCTIIGCVFASFGVFSTLRNIKIFSGYVSYSSTNALFDNVTIVRKSEYAITDASIGSTLTLKNCTLKGGSASWYAFRSDWFLDGIRLFKCINLTSDYGKFGNAVYCILHDYNGVTDDHRMLYREGNILADATTRHTASGISWRFEPSSLAYSNYPLQFCEIPTDLTDPFEVAVAANSQVTATIWCKKSSSDAGFEARFICKGGQLAGIASDVTAVATDSTDWQQLTIQVTPTEAGVLRFGFQVWGSATATCHIDDFGVSQ